MRKKLALFFLVSYKMLSHVNRQIILTSWGFVSECKHVPTCSEYMAQQIEKNGLKGFRQGVKRLLSCH